MKARPVPLFGEDGVTSLRVSAESVIAIMEVPGSADDDGLGHDWTALDSTNHGAGAVALLGGTPVHSNRKTQKHNRPRYSSDPVEEVRSNASEVGRKFAQASAVKVPRFRLTERSLAAQDEGDDAPRKIVADPSVTLCNRKHAGLLISVAFASLMSVGLKRGVLPLMQMRLKMEQYQVDAAELLLLLPWSCSFVLGFCADIFPIFGSHRKAYMMLGWALSAAALLAMATMHHTNDLDVKISNGDASVDKAEKEALIAGDVFLLGAACFGGILSVMMAEIYVIAFSKCEVLLQRGHLVGTFLCVQFGFQLIGQIITDVVVFHMGANNVMLPYIGFKSILLFFALFALVPIPILFYFFDDRLPEFDDGDDCGVTSQRTSSSANLDSRSIRGGLNDLEHQQQDDNHGRRNTTSKPMNVWCKVKAHWQLLWGTLEQKATWQIVCFLCVFIFFAEFTLRYPFVVLDQWNDVTAKSISTGKIFTELMFFLAACVYKGLCVNTQWSKFITLSYLGVFIFPPMTFFLLTTFDVSGTHLPLYMFVSSLQGFIRAMAVVIEVVMMIEIAPAGGEGAVLGTMVSIATIMRLISQTFSNSIGYLFGTQVLLTRKDSGVARTTAAADASATDEPMLVATALILCYTLRLLALIGVLFLPSQKVGLRRLLVSGDQKRYRAWWTLAILLVSVLIGTIVNTLVITPDTMCLHALGGDGCS